MALSLADELAGFDDPPTLESEVVGGLSLAEEFEMDGYTDGDTGLNTQSLGAELGASIQLSSEGGRVRKKLSAPALHDHPSDFPVPPPFPTGKEHHYTHNHKPSTFRQETRNRNTSNGHRRGKSSVSTSTMDLIDSQSFDPYDDTDRFHDDDQANRMLVDGDEGDMSFNSMAETSYQTAPLIPLSPGGDVDEREGAGGRGGGYPNNGYFGHSSRGKDPLVELQDLVNSNQRFIDALSNLDVDLSSSFKALKSSIGNRRKSPEEKNVPIEVKMQKHLERLHEDDRLREEQCRQLMVIARDLTGMTWDAEMGFGKGVEIVNGGELEMIDEAEDEGQGEEDTGWCGEPAKDLGARGASDGTTTYFPQRDELDDFSLEPSDLMDQTTLHGIDSPDIPTLKATAPTHLSLLPQVTREITDLSSDLINTLHSLGDTIHNSASFSTFSSRQIRGLKASIESWRERENKEEEARRVIESWERKRLEEGLKGKSQGENDGFGASGTRERLEGVCKGFEEVWTLGLKRMEEVRDEGKFRMAMAR